MKNELFNLMADKRSVALAQAEAEKRTRPVYIIAAEIEADWDKVNFAARPYLDAMKQMANEYDDFGADSAQSVVLYFLSNARSWRGEAAKRIKLELKALFN